MAHQTGASPGFCGMKRLGVSPLDGMLIHHRVTPSIKFAGTHLYTWVDRGTVRVKLLVQEHNTMSPARTRPGHLSPIYTAENFRHGSDKKKYAYQKNWCGTDRFCRVNYFAPSVLDQTYTRARTMSRGSPSTDKIGTRT